MVRTLYPNGVDVFPDHYTGSLLTRWEKIVLHTTESEKYVPNQTNYYGHQLWPHATLAKNVALGFWEIYNHLPLERSSACMRNLVGGVETNRDGCIQIEIAWKAANAQNLPKEALDLLKNWLLWVCDKTLIPYHFIDDFHFYPPENGIQLGKEPWRLRGADWDNFRGIVGHQNAAENVHGDPGKINVPYLRKVVTQPPTGGVGMKTLMRIDKTPEVYITDFVTRRHVRSDSELNHLLAVVRTSPAGAWYTVNGLPWVIREEDREVLDSIPEIKVQ